jgi:hypothetical protein
MRFDVKAMALAGALLWGFGLFLGTWWIILFDGASGEPTLVGQIYRGYTISPGGSIVGLLWALVDGAFAGALFAWLYNRFAGTSASG